MIEKISEKKNGWRFKDLTNDEWISTAKYYQRREGVRCVIVNDKTSKLFVAGRMGGRNIITVNNNVPDNELYFNKFC